MIPNDLVQPFRFHISRWICVVCFQIVFVVQQSWSQNNQSTPAYLVQGRIECKGMADGIIKYAASNTFEVVCRDSKVSIRTTGSIGKDEKDVYTMFSSDGVDSYRVTVFDIDQKTIEKNRGKNEKGGIFSSSVDVYQGGNPPNGLGLIAPVWLALASTLIIDSRNEGEIWPLVKTGPYAPAIGGEKLKATWIKSEVIPFLPVQVITYAKDKTFVMINKGEILLMREPFPQKYGQGFTNFIYQVLTWTNIEGLKIPQHFQLVSFYPKHDGKDKNDLQRHFVYDGYVETIAVKDVPQVEIPPKIPKWASVADYRFSANNENPLQYTSEFGELHSTPAAIANASAQDIVRMKVNDAKYRPFVIGVMVVFSVGSISFLFWFGRKMNNKNN